MLAQIDIENLQPQMSAFLKLLWYIKNTPMAVFQILPIQDLSQDEHPFLACQAAKSALQSLCVLKFHVPTEWQLLGTCIAAYVMSA